MSYPNIPDIKPKIEINRSEVITLMLASIGLEELALSHIMNAEAEKLQYVLANNPDFKQLIAIDKSVQTTLKDVIKKEMLLEFKLEEVMKIETEAEEE